MPFFCFNTDCSIYKVEFHLIGSSCFRWCCTWYSKTLLNFFQATVCQWWMLKMPNNVWWTKPLHVSDFQFYTGCYACHNLRQNGLRHVLSTWKGVPRRKCAQKVGEAFIFHDRERLSIISPTSLWARRARGTLISCTRTQSLLSKCVSCLTLVEVEVVGSSISYAFWPSNFLYSSGCSVFKWLMRSVVCLSSSPSVWEFLFAFIAQST